MSASSKTARRNWCHALYRMTTPAQSAAQSSADSRPGPPNRAIEMPIKCKGRGDCVTAVVRCVALYRQPSDRVADASDMSKQKPFDNLHSGEHDQRIWGLAGGCQDFMDAFHYDRYSGSDQREAHAQRRYRFGFAVPIGVTLVMALRREFINKCFRSGA